MTVSMSDVAASDVAASDVAAESLRSARQGASDDGGFWHSVREALRGSHRDYTEGPVPRAILVLAVPMVLEMVMESVFAICDVFFVSRLGANAVASVGLTESWLTIVYALAWGLAIAATALVARRTGERDAEGAAHAAAQAIALGAGVALVIGAVGGMFARQALTVMGASSDVLAIGTPYARLMLGGSMTIVMLYLINAVFRGAGDAVIAMRVLWLANGINVVLGPCLIFGLGPFPRMGVAGAALATNIGRGTGSLFAASRLLRPGGRLTVRQRHFRVDLTVLRGLLRLAWSASLQLLIGMASWIALVRILASFGSPVVAGYTIAVRVILFALLPASGLANAAATMVGQALGARKRERAAQAVKVAGLYNMVVLGLVSALLVACARDVALVFTRDPAVLASATSCLRIVAAGFVFYGWGMVLQQAFNGAGDTTTPTLLNLFVFWCWEIPLAYVLALRWSLGQRGVYLSMLVALSTFALAGGTLFRRGRWRERRV